MPSTPNYLELVQFIIEPFLEDPASLRVDIERCKENQRLWVRLAFDDADKGKVYGRGGRNLQAIRTTLEMAAVSAGRSVYLEVYEAENEGEQRRTRRSNGNFEGTERRPNNRRPPAPRRSTTNEPF
jgi:predicted RNA-binding protein YlqC (UPF0109 family)